MSNFRDYSNFEKAICNNYRKARQNQTLNFVRKMHKNYLKFEKQMKISEIFEHLKHFVDISDPDISLPNYHHAIQTAEGIRKDGHPEWLQFVGLIHDLGKIMFLWGKDEDGTTLDNQWAIVGDTFIVGSQIPNSIVFPEFNKENPDMDNPAYNTPLGIYDLNCGLDNVYCSWGHDEYLYQILKHHRNKHSLPDEALYIIRFHSLYTYHKEGGYPDFKNEKDIKMLKWLKLFNKFDLYTKADSSSITQDTLDYYNNLIDKYIPGGELWL